MKTTMSKWIAALLFLSVSAFAQTKVTYRPSDKTIANPERGFFSPFPGPTSVGKSAHRQHMSDQAILAGLAAIRANKQSLVSVGYDLKDFRNRRLSKAELQLMEKNFRLIREAGLKCVLRFSYSESIGQPDASLRIVLEQIRQLKPVLDSNADVITALQAGFIGAWGEWHSSTNGLDNVTDRRKILFAELDALPKDRMVQLRTPHFKQEIFDRTTPISRSEAFNGTKYSRVGEHNDCFLASWNDYETYADTATQERYISEDCLYVPMGGETCAWSKYAECANAIYQMARLHWSFLNSAWNPVIYEHWAEEGCLNEATNRLGYRFELLSGTFTGSTKAGRLFRYSIRLTNVGFAALYNPRDVEIVLRNKSDGDRYAAELKIDPRFWQPGDTVDVAGTVGVPSSLPAGTYSVYLNLPDPAPSLHFRPDYSIRFANSGVWEKETGYNNLHANLIVEPGGAGSKIGKGPVFKRLKASESAGTER